MTESLTKLSDVCPLCTKINKKSWIVVKTKSGRTMKICKQCQDDRENKPLDTSFQDKAKARVEAERKQNNQNVLRSYRIKP